MIDYDDDDDAHDYDDAHDADAHSLISSGQHNWFSAPEGGGITVMLRFVISQSSIMHPSDDMTLAELVPMTAPKAKGHPKKS